MTKLVALPFDHYQRYATVAQIVSSLGHGLDILEVGANRQRLLGDFLLGSRITYSDIEPQDGMDDFIVADACALPLGQDSMDCVVSLDVLEHIPPEMRQQAIREMCRVARRMVVIACPTNDPDVYAAEATASTYWDRYFDEPYVWLAEHQEFGLVDAAQVIDILNQEGWISLNLGQGEPAVWGKLMGLHFLREAFAELQPLVSQIDRLYNSTFYPLDRPELSYRRFFVALKRPEDMGELSARMKKSEIPTEAAAFLTELPETLEPMLERLQRAETEWKMTADLLRANEQKQVLIEDQQREFQQGVDQHIQHVESEWRSSVEALHDVETKLMQERQAHHHTGLKLKEASEASLHEVQHLHNEWRSSADLALRMQEELRAERALLHETGLRLKVAEETGKTMEREWKHSAELALRMQEQLHVERMQAHKTGHILEQGWKSSVQRIDQLSAELDLVRGSLDKESKVSRRATTLARWLCGITVLLTIFLIVTLFK